MNNTVIKVENLSKSFTVGVQNVPILKEVSLEVLTGDFLIIFGPSGCGKSTLLHSMLGLEEPNSGKVEFLGKDMYEGTTEDDRSGFRKEHVGMVYQQPNWIKALTVVENVAFPLTLLGEDKLTGLRKASQALLSVGMANWVSYMTSELSSGQQQKVALARALVTDPAVIVADEPTGNLDFESGQELMRLLSSLNRGYSPARHFGEPKATPESDPGQDGYQTVTRQARMTESRMTESKGKTIIMVTHDLEYLSFAKNALEMLDGSIIKQYSQREKLELISQIKSKRGNGNHV